MAEHDFRAALAAFERGPGSGPNIDAIREALRQAAARQEDREAVERGEAVAVEIHVATTSKGRYIAMGWDGFDDDPKQTALSDARRLDGGSVNFPTTTVRAIVRKPKPEEVEGYVE